MKTLALLFAAACVFAAGAALAAPPDPAIAGWDRGQAYDQLYDPNTEVVVSGAVLQVEKFTPREGMAEGVRVQVESRGDALWVHLAPAAWLAAQKIELGKGDKLSVTGSYLKIDGERVIMAAKLDREGKTLRLRDDKGKPAWSYWHPRPA